MPKTSDEVFVEYVPVHTKENPSNQLGVPEHSTARFYRGRTPSAGTSLIVTELRKNHPPRHRRS